MQQLILIPEPTKEEMIKEMLENWVAYSMLDIITDGYDAIREAHRKYYRVMFRIKDRYGLPYQELTALLRAVEKEHNIQTPYERKIAREKAQYGTNSDRND